MNPIPWLSSLHASRWESLRWDFPLMPIPLETTRAIEVTSENETFLHFATSHIWWFLANYNLTVLWRWRRRSRYRPLLILKPFTHIFRLLLSLSCIDRLYALQTSLKIGLSFFLISRRIRLPTLVKFSSAVQHDFSFYWHRGLSRTSQFLFYYNKFHFRWHVETNFAHGALKSSHVQYKSMFYSRPFLKVKNQIGSEWQMDEGLNINARLRSIFHYAVFRSHITNLCVIK